MPLRRAKDGHYIITSTNHIAVALARQDEVEAEIERLNDKLAKTKLAQEIEALSEENQALFSAVNEYVLARYKHGEGYEDDNWKITKVRATRRRWNPDVLKGLVSHGVFKNVVKVEVDSAKIDSYVRQGKIQMDDIAAAYEEEPTAPYVKRTKRSDSGHAGDSEASELLAALGG